MDESAAVVVWTVDPEGVLRFLLRHNKPFDGYDDEWTVCFGGIEEGESPKDAAIREASEEYGITEYKNILDLNYSVTWDGNNIQKKAHFFAIELADISAKIMLDEESIGYDWVVYEEAIKLMKYDDEWKALTMVRDSLS